MRHRWTGILWIAGFVIGGFSLPGTTIGQEAVQDTSRRISSSNAAIDTSANEELVLDEIQIRGRIERPGVLILPKRVEPEVEEVELDRSFKKEVKEGVGEVPTPESELGRVERVKNVKKTIKKKRK
jgi:hypothetical protein